MSKTNENNIIGSSKPRGVALNPAEAFELLRSAIWHCQQNGVEVAFVNKPDALWLKVPGAVMVIEGGEPIIKPVAVNVPEPT